MTTLPAADDRRPGDVERVVDELEERVVGQRVDQVRDEDDDTRTPAHEQDLDSHDDGPAREGPGSEPA